MDQQLTLNQKEKNEKADLLGICEKKTGGQIAGNRNGIIRRGAIFTFRPGKLLRVHEIVEVSVLIWWQPFHAGI